MANLKDFLPPAKEILELEPEEIAPFLLDYLCKKQEEQPRQGHNLYNTTNGDQIVKYGPGEDLDLVGRKIIEAWSWLEHEGMLAPVPNEPNLTWVYVTQKGFKYRNKADLETYRKGNLLPKSFLDEKLVERVYPLFLRGDYDTAVFQAFKEVEVRVRNKAGLPDDLIGVKLMREAFRPQKGKLTNLDLIEGEQQSLCELFSGSIGSFKNPSSHREIDLNNPSEAAEIILFANYLLRLVNKCKVNDV